MTNQLPPPTTPASTTSSSTRSTSRRLLAAGVGAGLLAGGAIGFVAGVPNLTSAATPAVIDQAVSQTDETDETDAPSGEEGDGGREATGERLRERLQPLVDDGTIDAGQADAVSAFLAEQWNEHSGGRGGPGHRGGPRHEAVETVAEVLGIDADTLGEELRAGSSLAEIAEANGVDAQTLIDALVAEAQTKLDEAVADGRIDEDEAAERSADLDERVTARVNGERPERPENGERLGRPARPGADAGEGADTGEGAATDGA